MNVFRYPKCSRIHRGCIAELLSPLEFGFQGNEDFDITFTLYDVEKRKRLSESWYYSQKAKKGTSPENVTVLVDMPYASPHIYVIARVYRVLKGPLDDASPISSMSDLTCDR